jgi:triacylglycerol lipase
MKRVGAMIAALLCGAGSPALPEAPIRSDEAVVLVHGIMNKPFVMNRIAAGLRKQGYEVHNWGYPSTGGLIEDHAARLGRFLDGLGDKKKIHFVGFSQGAIIIRYTLTHHPLPNSGRFVMVAPPNHGCELAEAFYRYGWFRGLYGDKSIKQLFVRQNEFLATCGIPSIEFGIIAGGKGDGKGYLESIPGDDDGTISVASAHLEGARDFILLPHQHTPLVFASDTVSQVEKFLKEGKFKR